MTVEETKGPSPLQVELAQVAAEIAKSGSATREFPPEQVVQLAKSAIAERGKADSVKDLTVGLKKSDDGQPLLHVGIELTKPIKLVGSTFSADLENAKSDRRDAVPDPSEDRVRIRGKLPRAAAGAVLGGDMNDLFVGEVKKSLPNTAIAGVGLRVTPKGLRVTIKGQ